MALMVKTYPLRCPYCGRFLAEVEGMARLVCRECGGLTIWVPKGRRPMPGGGLDRLTGLDIIETTE